MEAALFLRKSWALVARTCWRSLNHGGGEGTRVSIKVNVLESRVEGAKSITSEAPVSENLAGLRSQCTALILEGLRTSLADQ